uniref:Uncharacterized protein n=1 Tax=Pseudictyota dubia TaxID=2749911 RepID=A0A7R9VME1_9STRA
MGEWFDSNVPFKEGSDRKTTKKECDSLFDSDDGTTCYDSDPGEVIGRRHGVRSLDKGEVSAENMNITLKAQSSMSRSTMSQEVHPGDAPVPCDELFSSMDVSDAAGERNILLTVQETLNQTLYLTWHPSIKSKRNNGKDCEKVNTSPRFVRVWFERGHGVGQGKSFRLIEPKLVWQDALNEDVSLESQEEESNCCRGQFALLDVGRVLRTSSSSTSGGVSIDRSKYPTARASCSFLVRTVDGQEFLFEGRTSAERDVIVYQWKATIARFASIIIVENSEAMKSEFFLPTNFLKSAEYPAGNEVEER